MNIMKINNNRNYPYAFNFKSKVKTVNYGSITQEYKDFVDKFEEGDKSKVKYLGSGLFAKVYRILGTDYVIKMFNKGVSINDSRHEAYMLNEAGNIPDTQQLMAQVTTEKNQEFLITTFVKGEEPDYIEFPLRKKSLAKFLTTLFELDKKEVYHNDLNMGNCKVDPLTGTIGLIDFQFAMKMHPEYKEYVKNNLLFPNTILPANIQMFEMATLPSYMSKMPESEAQMFFKEYLSLKSEYHKRRYTHYRNDSRFNKISKNLDYELYLSKVLKDPSKEIVDLYAQKLQVLHSFRECFSLTDANTRNLHRSNLPEAGSAFIYATVQAAKYKEKIKNLSATTNDMNIKRLMAIESDSADFWLNKLSSGAIECSQWHIRNCTGNLLSANDKYPETLDFYWNKPNHRFKNLYGMITQYEPNQKISCINFSSELNTKYEQAFKDIEGFFSIYNPTYSKNYFANFKTVVNKYKSAINAGKVAELPKLHGYVLHSGKRLLKHSDRSAFLKSSIEKLEEISQPLIMAVVNAAKGNYSTLNEALKCDNLLHKMGANNRVTLRNFIK